MWKYPLPFFYQASRKVFCSTFLHEEGTDPEKRSKRANYGSPPEMAGVRTLSPSTGVHRQPGWHAQLRKKQPSITGIWGMGPTHKIDTETNRRGQRAAQRQSPKNKVGTEAASNKRCNSQRTKKNHTPWNTNWRARMHAWPLKGQKQACMPRLGDKTKQLI